jgi:hypothetical protein
MSEWKEWKVDLDGSGTLKVTTIPIFSDFYPLLFT